MTQQLIDILHQENCSLVVQDTKGEIRTFFKKGVRDLEDLLDHEPSFLRGAMIADKVIGKAAAGMAAFGGVREIYANVMSRHALPLLEGNGIAYSYDTLVDQIVIPIGDTRCRLEEIVAPAQSAKEVVAMLRHHWEKK